jgi:signal transduction histidine kinase
VLRPTALAKHIELELSDDGETKLVLGDSARLQQIVWNLVANAVKFTPERGKVRVLLRNIDRSVELSVSDNGQGIPQELLPFVFERFWQAETPARTQPGLGLGLAITRNLVELHGGTIRATSDGTGTGANFIVQLPVADARSSESLEASNAAEVEVPPTSASRDSAPTGPIA